MPELQQYMIPGRDRRMVMMVIMVKVVAVVDMMLVMVEVGLR